MKKFLFLIAILAVGALAQQSFGQSQCGSGFIRHWTAVGDDGDMGAGPAPLSVDGSMNDWIQYISGPFAYGNVPKAQNQLVPHPNPVAPANAQVDGIGSVAGGNYDRDCSGQPHRDLAYFASTYDRTNIYFYFRRASNTTAQVALYYFIDINLDGWMKTGEPVIKVSYNGGIAQLEMGWYEATTGPNGTPASAYDPVKGNIMTAPVARTQSCPNTSQWTIGAADGWSMPGEYHTATPAALRNNINGINELFKAFTITETHTDGDIAGYGTEFVIPWNYLTLYNTSGQPTGTALTYQNIFTWHVSLVNGNSGIYGALDNAGGCCSGLAFSGNANTDLTATVNSELIWQQKFRTVLTYTEQLGFSTNVTMPQVKISNIQPFGPVPPDPTTEYIVTVYPANAAGVPQGAGTVFAYSAPPNSGVYTYSGTPVVSTAAANGDAKFVVDVDFGPGKKTKGATINYITSNDFNIGSLNCSLLGSTPGNDINIIVTTLPVSYTSFTAVRNHSNVVVKWGTATEINNSGFYVERNVNGNWETLGFVPSQAINGTSQGALNYQFVDVNNTKGITQYRLRQVDLDSKTKYSDIRTVRGENQLGQVVVYPNPSSDGKINIVFEDQSATRDIAVADMAGRIVKQVRGVTNNNITIDNLVPGVYSIRIVVPATGDQTVEKVVVSKR